MDKKLLEDKLSEIAEWTYPCLSDATAIERVIPENGSKDYKQTFNLKPDLGPRIIRFKDSLRPCEWCGKILEHKKNITKHTIPRRGDSPAIVKWHISCYNCHRVYDPVKKELQPVSKSIIAKRKKNQINNNVSDEK
jgi:hypothetical protein